MPSAKKAPLDMPSTSDRLLRIRPGGHRLQCSGDSKRRLLIRSLGVCLVGMGWQEAIVLAVVAVTILAFAWSWFRPRKVSFHRQTGCGCSGVAAGSQQS